MSHPKQLDDQALLAATEDELRALSSIRSFDEDRLREHLKGDQFQQVLHGHLYFDHVLTALLTEEFKNPKAVDLTRTSFAQKLSLVDALGLLPHDLVPGIAALNRLRNRLAHNLNATIGESELTKLRTALPSALQKEVREAKHNVGPLCVMIVHLLFSAENARQANAYRRVSMRRWHAQRRDFLQRIDTKATA